MSFFYIFFCFFFFFFQAEDGIRDHCVTGVQTCALPICCHAWPRTSSRLCSASRVSSCHPGRNGPSPATNRSEEHTSELQSHSDLVCRLLLEKKKKKKKKEHNNKQTTQQTTWKRMNKAKV